MSSKSCKSSTSSNAASAAPGNGQAHANALLAGKPKGAKGTAILSKNPVQVARRNARERNRVRQVNQGFIKLRDTIPNPSKSKKLSKVDTLRQAAAYIKYLHTVLTAPATGDGVCKQAFPALLPGASNGHLLPIGSDPFASDSAGSSFQDLSSCSGQNIAYQQQHYVGGYYSPASGHDRLGSPSENIDYCAANYPSQAPQTIPHAELAYQHCQAAVYSSQAYVSTSGVYANAGASAIQHRQIKPGSPPNAYYGQYQTEEVKYFPHSGIQNAYASPSTSLQNRVQPARCLYPPQHKISPNSDESPTPSCLSETSFTDYAMENSPSGMVDIKPYLAYGAYQ